MNWTEIKERCPEAYTAFIKTLINVSAYGSIDQIRIQPDFNHWYLKWDKNSIVFTRADLYGFFDGHKLKIKVPPPLGLRKHWKWSFWDKDKPYQSTKKYRGRTESENEAFDKAFEILEEKL